jgi:hypothetical protein
MNIFKNLFNSKSNSDNFSQWSDLGTITDGFEIQYLHPDHHTYPAWPGGDRRLNLLKTKWNTEIIFSDGLSKIGSQNNYEVYLETNEDVEDFSSSWQANVVYEIGRLIPKVTDLKNRFSKNKYLTVQVQIDGAPDEWSLMSADGNIGILLGLENPNLENLNFPFIPINIKLMRPQEIQYVIKNGAEGRNLLASLYSKQGGQTLSYLDRVSVL